MTEQAEGDPAISAYSAQVAKNEGQRTAVWGSTLERAALSRLLRARPARPAEFALAP